MEVESPHQALQQCDRVEVFESGWAEADPLHLGLGGPDLERSRALLQRIFTRSGSLPADALLPFPSTELGGGRLPGRAASAKLGAQRMQCCRFFSVELGGAASQ